MNNSIKQSNFDELIMGLISPCVATKLTIFDARFSYHSDDYSEGTLNGKFEFASFQTPRGTLILVEHAGAYYPTFHTDGFWTNDRYPYGHNTEECFELCIEILNNNPEEVHHNVALFSALKKYTKPTSLSAQ